MKRFYVVFVFCIIFLVCGCLFHSVTAVAEEVAETSLEVDSGDVFMNIGEVTVQADGDSRRNIDLPGSVDVIGQDQIGKTEGSTALDLLRLVPGLAIGDYNSGGVPNGFTLRGFGMGSHGNHTAVTIDGIPYNYHMGSADGAVDLNQLSSEDIVRVEVVKGPIDARYGNWTRGGIVHFHTRNRGDFNKAKLSAGSFDTKKAFVSIGNESKDNRFNQVYSVEYYDTDGFRDNGDYSRQNAYGKWFYRPQSNIQLGLILHTYTADWHTAGYLPESAWKVDPEQSVQEDDGGWKKLNEAQVHVDWNISESMPLEIKAWTVKEDYSRFADWGSGQTESHYDHNIFGIVSNLGFDKTIAGNRSVSIDAGFDYRHFGTDDKKYNTTYRHRTQLTKDKKHLLNNLGIYTKASVEPVEILRLFAGIRHDKFGGDSKDNLNGGTLDLENYDSIWSCSGGAIMTFFEKYSVYANFGTAYQLPRNEAKYQINSPAQSNFIHYEAGFKANPVEQILLRFAFFMSKNDDEITWSAGEFQHEGESYRRGHEIELNLKPLESFELFAALTLQKATYEAGVNKGNRIPSVPEYTIKTGAEYRLSAGTGIRCWYTDVGKWYTQKDNTTHYNGYDVFDLKMYQPFGNHWTVSFDARNIFDETYSEYVGNWSGENQYAASPGRNFLLTLSYEI